MMPFTKRRSAAPGARRVLWATLALWAVRVWIAVWLATVGLTLIGDSDRALGDRLSFQEYGFAFPTKDGGVEEHEGPFLVLTVEVDRLFCPSLNRPYDESDPATVPFYGKGACALAKTVRSDAGDVDVNGLRLVRQVEGPPGRVERELMLVLFAGYAAVLLASFSLERILRLTSQGRPFSRAAVRWLRALAAGVAGAAVVVPYVTDRFIDGLTRRYFASGDLAAASDGTRVDLASVFVIVLILVIAEVWRAGIRLQDDVEATV